MKKIILFLLGVVGLFSCIISSNKESSITHSVIPKVKYPKGNEYTKERYELGEKLFFDPVLSKDSTLSCSSCHKPDLFFADTIAFTSGIKGRAAKRNVPSIINVGYQPYLLREGGVATLEMQVLVPIQEENEFNHNIVDIGNKLKEDTTYNNLSIKAYNRPIDSYVITRSIALFERSLIGFTSKFDRYKRGGIELTKEEEKGMNLFNNIGCTNCHSGFNFTNYSFANIGLYKTYKDSGRYRLTKDSIDIGRFKVPSLRNVAKTYPYMHDGSFKTLEEVLSHYQKGGESHVNKNPEIKSFNLNEKEKKSIIAFLETLTDR